VILIDSSAWIEFLRDTGSDTCLKVEQVLEGDFAICEPIRMEVLAGGRDEVHLMSLRRLLAMAVLVSVESRDYDFAAALYRRCRRRGETVRKLMDCLIAAVAIRAAVPVRHSDQDFEVLARHTQLQVLT